MNYMRGFTDLKEQRQLHALRACSLDAKEGDRRFRSGDLRARAHPAKFFVCLFVCTCKGWQIPGLRSAWDRGSLCPGPDMVIIVMSGQCLIQLSYCLCLCLLPLFTSQGAEVMEC